MSPNGSPRGRLGEGLLTAGLLLGGTLALQLLSARYISAELAMRGTGVLIGAVLVWYANAAPKAIPRGIEARCADGGVAIRRFVGWAIVLGGLAYIFAWIVAPFRIASLLATALLGVALLVVLARLAFVRTRGGRSAA